MPKQITAENGLGFPAANPRPTRRALLLGGLGLLAMAVGLLAARVGTPVLLVFLALGMLAGEDGPGGIQFDDFAMTYLAGSVALGVLYDHYIWGLVALSVGAQIAAIPVFFIGSVESGTSS